jgi:hypothetical protein
MMANQFDLTITVNDIRGFSSDCINDQYCHNLTHNEDDSLVQLDHSQIVE